MATDKPNAVKKKKFKMPNAYVIIFFALFITVILTFFIPTSVRLESGEVVYNAILGDDGSVIENAGPQAQGLWDILMAPIRGFQDGSDVAIALLIAGGFLNVLNVSGGLEAGIGKLLGKLKGNALVIIMLLVFSLLGTVFGFWEEITAFSIVIVPLFMMAGYDALTGLAVLFVGATVGNMAAVVNPFATGAAVAAIGNPDLTLGSGIILRGVLFIVLSAVACFFVVSYASKVRKDKTKSMLADVEGVKKPEGDVSSLPEMNGKRLASLIVFILIVVFMLIGYIPWADIGGEAVGNIVNAPITRLSNIPVLGDIFGAAHITPFGEWGFDEFSFLFFLGSLLLLLINRMKVDDFIDNFLDGAKGLLGVVLVLAISRGIAIVMGDSTQGMSVTFVYWISNALKSVPLWIFGVFAVLAYVGIGVFLQSTSGVAGISMPILGAVAAALFAASAIGSDGGQVILISAFTLGINFMCGIYPEATILGTIEMFGVPYDKYLKFMLRCTIPILIIGTIIISIAPYIGLA